jgi:hypothetical protein
MFDSVWFWAISSIASALLGAAALAYIKDTKLGIWGYRQFDKVLDLLRDKYHIHALDQPIDAWRSQEPEIAAKIDELEARIKRLEDR